MKTNDSTRSSPGRGRIRDALGRIFLSLQHRNFQLYFTGQFISNTGNWLTNVALTLFVLKLTRSGVLLAGPTALGGPLLGWLADMNGGRAPLVVGGLVCLVAATFGYGAARHYVDESVSRLTND